MGLVQWTVGEDELEQLAKAVLYSRSWQEFPPGLQNPDTVVERGHQSILKVVSCKEVEQDFVINEAVVPHEDVVVGPETSILKSVGKSSRAYDRQIARILTVDLELVCSLPDFGLRDNALKLFRRDWQLKSVVQDCFVG